VHTYMARYNVSLLAGGGQPDFLSLCIGEPVTRFAAEQYAMMRLLREFYFVHTIVIPAYVLSAGRMGRTIELSGRVENLKMADYVYAFLNRTVEEQWQAFGGSAGSRRRTDFACGLLQGFRETLEKQEDARAETSRATRALVALGERQADEYWRARYPRLRTVSRRGRFVDPDVVAAGVAAGRRTVLSRPIEGAVGRRGLLLEG
jgi:hypothetical protein